MCFSSVELRKALREASGRTSGGNKGAWVQNFSCPGRQSLGLPSLALTASLFVAVPLPRVWLQLRLHWSLVSGHG